MKYYYHATPAENVESIMKEGLKPGCLGCVCMTEDPNEAVRFPYLERPDADTIVTLKIKTLKKDEDKIEETFDHSYNFWQCRCYGFFDTIPPERLELAYVLNRNDVVKKTQEEK